MINYLTQNKLTAWLALTAYFLGLVYFHDAATVAADWLKYKLTITYYNPFLLVTGLSFSLLMAFILFRKAKKDPGRRIFLILFLLTTLFMVLALFTLMVVNMEAIHYPQYAMLAILIFPLVRRYSDAFVIASALGIIDEIYQYIVLNPTFKYLDFNDFILNMLGAGAGLLILAALNFPERLSSEFKRFSFFDYPSLTFEQPNTKNFRNLALAFNAPKYSYTSSKTMTE